MEIRQSGRLKGLFGIAIAASLTTDGERLVHLVALLDGEARRAVAGINLTSENVVGSSKCCRDARREASKQPARSFATPHERASHVDVARKIVVKVATCSFDVFVPRPATLCHRTRAPFVNITRADLAYGNRRSRPLAIGDRLMKLHISATLR